MSNKQYILFLFIGSVIVLGLLTGTFSLVQGRQSGIQTESLSAQPVASTISADGTIRSENEAILNFQIGGQLVYLPFKEGDTVQQGQVIASLDQRTIQKTLENAVNAYENQKISYDIVNDFNGDRALSETGLSIAARRQLQTAVNTLTQAQIAVDIQQIAKDQSILISPLNGLLVHEDVTVPYVNITPTTQFAVADPNTPVFRANVSENDIDFVFIGAPATIQIDGIPSKKFQGTVSKVHPEKITLANGQQIYQIDIHSDSLLSYGKLQQSGTALISNKTAQRTILVPAWLVLSRNTVWVLHNNTPVLQQVTLGKVHGNAIEVLSGLDKEDKIITHPESIVNRTYEML